MATSNQFDIHSEDYVKNMRIRFREQAARFLEDVSFDVGAVLARDLSLQDEDTKNRLSELQKGLSEQVQHMQKVIKKEKSVLVASSVHRHKKDIHFTQNELKTLHEIAKQENDPNGVVSMFLKRREEGVARSRYKEFVKRAEAKYFEHRRDGRKGKFDFRHAIRDSMRLTTAPANPSETKKRSKSTRVPKLLLPDGQHSQDSIMTSSENSSCQNRSENSSCQNRSEISSVSASDHSSTVRSAPTMFSARLAAYKSAIHSARWNPREERTDPDTEAIRQILDELSETVELLVDFEHQPFQTAVPPQYTFHKPDETVDDGQLDQREEEGEPGVDDEGRDDDNDGIAGETDSHISEDQPDDDNDAPIQNLEPNDNAPIVDGVSTADAEGEVATDNPVEVEEEQEPSCIQPQLTESAPDQVLNDTEVQEVMQEVLATELLDDVEEDKEDSDVEPGPIEPSAPKPMPVPVEKQMKPVVSRGHPPASQSAVARFMGPKKQQIEPVRGCHRKSRESSTNVSRQRRNVNRSRSPWRHPERFPQIKDAQSRPNPKKQLKPLARNQSATKLPDTK